MSRFQLKHHSGLAIGWEKIVNGALFFFGTKYTTLEMLPAIYPQFKFHTIKQVHGDTIIEAQNNNNQGADGQWTNNSLCALVIQTADCVPILLRHKNTVMALHAGWRGVHQQILRKGIDVLNTNSDDMIYAALGPHIRLQHFEVGLDVVEKLRSTTSLALEKWTKTHADKNKMYVDLEALLISQAPQSIQWEHIYESTVDNPLLYSYRQAYGLMSRQYSFVARLD